MKASNSAIQLFKQCRRAYELRYKYNLVPVQTADALKRGLGYHGKVEQILKSGTFEKDEDLKTNAMAMAFKKYIVDNGSLNVDVTDAEKWFNYDLRDSNHTLVGRVDAYGDGVVIEHKTTSGLIDGAYFQKLEFDEQIPSYMLAVGVNKILYTVCSTPTIRQKKDETDEEFEARCLEWFADDTEHKIAVVTITKTNEELEAFSQSLNLMFDEIEHCKHYYKNPGNCNKWGRLCEYAPICNAKVEDLTAENLINYQERQVYNNDEVGKTQT